MNPDESRHYDALLKPANIDVALMHANACKFATPNTTIELNHKQVCPCCGLPTISQEIPICSTRTLFNFNGVGVQLYFDFLAYATILLAIFIVISGIYNLSINAKGDRCEYETIVQPSVECIDNFYNMYSQSNLTDGINKPGSILNLVVTIVMMIVTIYYRRHIVVVSSELDETYVLASDYSILVENIPKDAKLQEITDYFKKDIGDTKIELKKVAMGYEMQEYFKLQKDKQLNQTTLAKIIELEQVGKVVPPELPSKDTLQNIVETIQHKLDHYDKHLDTSFKFSGVAIITYNTEQQANKVCDYYKANKVELLYSKIKQLLNKPDCRIFGDRIILVSRAPNPGAILWENLGMDIRVQQKRRLITSLMILLILSISFGIIIGLSYAQQALSSNDAKQAQTLMTILGTVSSIVIQAINIILAKVIRKQVELEQHCTQTAYDINVAQKVGLAQFINTGLINLFVALAISASDETLITSLWKSGGLNTDIMILFIANAIVPSIGQLIDFGYFRKLYRRYQLVKQDNTNTCTQQEANEIFTVAQIDLAEKYAQLSKTVMFALFYASLLPLGSVISLFSLLAIYWIEKYILLRRQSQPIPNGSQMVESMVDFYVDLYILAYSSGCCIWETVLYDEVYPITWVQLALSIAYFLIPIRHIIPSLFEVNNPPRESYDDKQLTFWDDYDRRNPVTAQQAIQTWLKLQQDVITNNDIKLSRMHNAVIRFNIVYKQSHGLTTHTQIKSRQQ